jgi:hypothetical protein
MSIFYPSSPFSLHRISFIGSMHDRSEMMKSSMMMAWCGRDQCNFSGLWFKLRCLNKDIALFLIREIIPHCIFVNVLPYILEHGYCIVS